MKTIISFSIFLCIYFFIHPVNTKAQCHIDDWKGLKAWYVSSNALALSGWSETFKDSLPNPGCNLAELDISRITLNENGRVKSIDMRRRPGQLPFSFEPGSLPPEIGLLSELEILNLWDTDLEGEIPEELYSLKKLKVLNLGGNDFSGNISSITSLTNLTELTLANTKFTGDILGTISQLTSLTKLDLYSSNLTGSIPESIGQLTKLTKLDIGNNNLTGNIPASFGNLFSSNYTLNDLTAFSNNLSGCFHPDLAKLCNRFRSFRININGGNNFDAEWVDFCETGDGACETGKALTFGCKEQIACNFNPEANYENNTFCTYAYHGCDCNNEKPGCTDVNALNYDSSATCSDGLCKYEPTLVPQTYDFVVWNSDRYLVTRLQNVCTSDTFIVEENTTNGSITIEGNRLKVGFDGGKNGLVKIATRDGFGCLEEWTFNIFFAPDSIQNATACGDNLILSNPWLSHLIDFDNCSNVEVGLYRIPEDAYYIPGQIGLHFKNGEGGALYYPFIGQIFCSNYINNNRPDCLNGSELRSQWICPANRQANGCKEIIINNIYSNLNLARDFNIFPNPANNNIFIELPNQSAYEISLTNILGKVMKQIEAQPNAKTVNVNVRICQKEFIWQELGMRRTAVSKN